VEVKFCLHNINDFITRQKDTHHELIPIYSVRFAVASRKPVRLSCNFSFYCISAIGDDYFDREVNSLDLPLTCYIFVWMKTHTVKRPAQRYRMKQNIVCLLHCYFDSR